MTKAWLALLMTLLLGGSSALAQPIQVNLRAGWNPVGLQRQRLTEVQVSPGVVSLAVFDGSAYHLALPDLSSFNGGEGGQRGLWVYCTGPATLGYAGLPAGPGVDLRAGWNLVSLGSSEAPGQISGPSVAAFEIDPASNESHPVESAQLKPGGCYWLFAPQAGRLSWGPRPLASPGGPLPELDAGQLQRFERGRQEFSHELLGGRELGPIFNGSSCVQCHKGPAPGGGSTVLVSRFGRTSGGLFDPLIDQGGSALQLQALGGHPPERVPADANLRAFRRSTPMFAFGLVEAIPDEAILELAARQLRETPAQAGRANVVEGRVGRFGWKCQHATLRGFVGDALAEEEGVSNAAAPFEPRPNLAPRPVPADQLEDRPGDDGSTALQRLTDFVRYLAPLPTGPPSPAGERLFHGLGCAICHHPALPTASSEPALAGRSVFAYTDFLLHDVGTGDGIEQAGAPASMLRTAPLMGVARLNTWLHDGTAQNLGQAILAHGGQATVSRQAFAALSPADRQALLEFLTSL